MARRVPKPLVPVLVALAGAGLAFGAALPSFAGPNTPPPADSVPQHPLPADPTGGAPATTTTPAPGPTTTPRPTPTPKPSDTYKGDQGPKDCSDCGLPTA